VYILKAVQQIHNTSYNESVKCIYLCICNFIAA